MKHFYILFFCLFSSFIFAEDITKPDTTRAFQENEKLIFDISYGIINAGTASLELEPVLFKDSIKCLKITSLAKTNSFFDNIFEVRDRIESIWDINKRVSYKFKKRLREGSYQQFRIHFYYPDINKSTYISYDLKHDTKKEKVMDIAENTQDILSSLYWLRDQKYEIGDTLVVNVTADAVNYPAKVIVHKREVIESIFGKKSCLVLEPLLEGDAIFKQTGKIFIWLTDDQYKVPLKMSSKIIFGSFEAILGDAKNVPYKKI